MDCMVCSIAGCGIPGYSEGNRVTCRLNCPSGIAIDRGDGIWTTDRQNHCVRRLPGTDEKTLPGKEDDIITIAGRSRKLGFRDGKGRDAQFYEPGGICSSANGDGMYVSDRENHSIRFVTEDGVVSTVCGGSSKESGWRDGPGHVALFNRPFGIACSAAAIFVADTGNHLLRKVDYNGTVSTVLGTDKSPEHSILTPFGVCVDGTNCLYVSEWGSHRVRRVAPDGKATVCIGSGQRGKVDGRATEAMLNYPAGLAVDPRGVLYVADWGNHCIRRMSPSGDVTTIGVGGSVLVDDGVGYVSSPFGCLDGPGNVAAFNSPQDVAVDSCGDVLVADWGNHCIRKIESI